MDQHTNNLKRDPEDFTSVTGSVDVKVLIGCFVLLAVIVFVGVLVNSKMHFTSQVPTTVNTETAESNDTNVDINAIAPSPLDLAPGKTELDDTVPPEVTEAIPVKVFGKISQSYTQTYVEGEQSTLVFYSSIDPKNQYDELKKLSLAEGWNIINDNTSTQVSGLYAMRKNSELNITVVTLNESESAENSAQSRVSISVLNTAK